MIKIIVHENIDCIRILMTNLFTQIKSSEQLINFNEEKRALASTDEELNNHIKQKIRELV